MISFSVGRLAVVMAVVAVMAGCASRQSAKDAPKAIISPEQVRVEAEQAVKYGDYAGALGAWQKLLAKTPDDVVALRGVGEVYSAVGEHALALTAYDKVLGLLPTDTEAQEGRGLALLALGRHEEARRQLEQLQQGAPSRWRTLNAMGLLLDLEGKRAQAWHSYESALALQPGNPLILNNMGYSLLMAQDYAGAERLFSDGLRGAPDGAYLHANLVLAIAWQGDYARAVTEASRRQAREEALNNVGYVALLRKDYKLAIRYFEQAIEASPRWYPRAAANLERARKALEDAGDRP